MNSIRAIIYIIGLLCVSLADYAQPNTTIDLDGQKPKKYENRKLGAEKTGRKKFNLSRRGYHNMVTHFNYYFNANNRLNDVIERAKISSIDDYTKLLSFYNYTLDGTARSKSDLDSIIYKCTAGILLHDLRSDWVDDMYLLLGKAYFFRKNFDSAYIVFQYINYAFAKRDDEYDTRKLGSNENNPGGIFTVSTDESNRNWIKKVSSKPPARNDAFIWLVRNYIEQNRLSEASGLLAILDADPEFPKRLETDKHEMKAYLYYKMQAYDSAAYHLEKALNNANNRQERARWEYLCAQLYQLAGKKGNASALFGRSIKHTFDPYMDVYARLNIVGLSSSSTKENAILDNMNKLYKLAKRDKYHDYRDIIYYVAALLQLQQGNLAIAQRDKMNVSFAQRDLLKSIQYNVDNPSQKAKSFMLLADINYDNKNYHPAYNYYDSLLTNHYSISDSDKVKVETRKSALKIIIKNADDIYLQDSLQALSALPEGQRIAFVKMLYRRLKRGQDSDNLDVDYGNVSSNSFGNNAFGNNSSNSADFYFNNESIKLQGFKDFKTRWGTRPNVDNWRRQTAVAQSISSPTFALTNPDALQLADKDSTTNTSTSSKELSYESMLLNIPMTRARKDSSDKIISKALFSNGLTFQNKLEDYPSAIQAYEELLHRFPSNKNSERALFNLIYCYKKTEAFAKADSATQQLNASFPDGKLKDVISNRSVEVNAVDAQRKYLEIYNLFAEGEYRDAETEKIKADSLYGKSFWTPQLLYIESVYFVNQRQDSAAINTLKSLVKKFPSSQVSDKAKSMIDVLQRRKEIESYLDNLDIDLLDDSLGKRFEWDIANIIATGRKIKVDTILNHINTAEAKQVDFSKMFNETVNVNSSLFTFNPDEKHYAVILLNEVDEVFVREAEQSIQFTSYRIV